MCVSTRSVAKTVDIQGFATPAEGLRGCALVLVLKYAGGGVDLLRSAWHKSTSSKGHEQACRRARQDGESSTVTRLNRGSAAKGRSVPGPDLSMRNVHVVGRH